MGINTDLLVLHYICLLLFSLLSSIKPSLHLVFSIILSTFVSLTHSLTLSPLLMSHISAPSPPHPLLPDAYDSHWKCLYLLLFISFLPHSHSYLIHAHRPTAPYPFLSSAPLLTVFLPPPAPLR